MVLRRRNKKRGEGALRWDVLVIRELEGPSGGASTGDVYRAEGLRLEDPLCLSTRHAAQGTVLFEVFPADP